MKRFYIILSIIIFSAIAGAYLLINTESLREPFGIVKDVLGLVQVFISIFLVYLLYDRFGTSKKLLDKQNDLIIKFLEELKKVHLYIHGKTENGLESTIHSTLGKNLSFAKESSVCNKIALFNSSQFYNELKKLNEIIEHPLFPSDLKDKADIFKFGVMTGTLEIDYEKYGFVSFVHNDSTTDEKWMYPYDGDMTIRDYLAKVEKSITELENWINKESSIKIKLNLS